MEINVLNEDFESVCVIDEFESLIWTERYASCGDFEIYTLPSQELLSEVKQGYYLSIEDSDRLMIVENIKTETDVENGTHLIISGRSLESILDRRIIWSVTKFNGSLQKIIRKAINQNAISPTLKERRIPNLVFSATDDELANTVEFTMQATGDNLLEFIENLCQASGVGFKLVRSQSLYEYQRLIDHQGNFITDSNGNYILSRAGTSGELSFSLYSGTDRSYNQIENAYVIFSPKMDNVIKSDYLESSANYRNVTLVAGEDDGVGVNRRTRVVGEKNAKGLERRELFTDARDVQSESEDGPIADPEYYALLDQRGTEKLAELAGTIAFEYELDPSRSYTYKVDYDLGDTVQVINEYGVEAQARITEIIRSYDENGYYLYPTIGNLTTASASVSEGVGSSSGSYSEANFNGSVASQLRDLQITSTNAEQMAMSATVSAEDAKSSATRARTEADSASAAAAEAWDKADSAGTAAQEAWDHADEAATAADAAQSSADAAQASADSAADAAQNAWAHADSAATAAQTAWNHAEDANVAAANAQSAATRANGHANDALVQLSIVEDVAGTLAWIQEHASFVAATDTTVQEGTVYFVYNSTTQDYEPIIEPDTTKNPHTEGWYVLNVQDSQTEFIMAHLAVTSRGLWVLPSGIGSSTTPASGESQKDSDARQANNYKVLLASDGMYLYDSTGAQVVKYGSSIDLGSGRPFSIGTNQTYITYYDSNNDNIADAIAIGGNVTFGTKTLTELLSDLNGIPTDLSDLTDSSGVIPTNVSELNNDSGYQTSSQVSSAIGTATSGMVTNVTTKDQYYLSTSNSSATGGTWQDTVPTWSSGKYIWTRVATTKTTSTGSTTEYSTAVYDSALTKALSDILTKADATSAVASVVTTKQYYLSSSSSSATGGSWSDSVPTWSSGKYVWVRFKIVTTPVSGNASTSYSPNSNGTYDSALTTALQTANDAAPKTSAVGRQQRIYYRKTSSGAPSKNNTWLSTSGTGYGNWSLKIPQLTNGNTKYPYLYTAIQSQTVAQQAAGNTCTCSDVLLDDTTTVIDGGNIITGTVTANKLDANNINASGSLTIGAMSSSTQSSILNSELSGDISDAAKVARSYITNVTSNGMFIHDASATDVLPTDSGANGVHITNRVHIIRNGESVSEFGESVRVGKKNASHVIMYGNQTNFYSSINSVVASIQSSNQGASDIETVNLTRTFGLDGVVSYGETLGSADLWDVDFTLGNLVVQLNYAKDSDSWRTDTLTFTTEGEHLTQDEMLLATFDGEHLTIEYTYPSSTSTGITVFCYISYTRYAVHAKYQFGITHSTLGDFAMVSGQDVDATGKWSQAFGYKTIATGRAQMVVGECNVIDTSDVEVYPSPGRQKYMFIVGNGVDEQNRSNAFAVTGSGDVEVKRDADIGGDISINDNMFINCTTTHNSDLYTAINALGWISEVID